LNFQRIDSKEPEMMQAGGWVRRVGLVFRRGGWAVLCSAFMLLVAPAPVQAAHHVKKPAKTASAAKTTKTARVASVKQSAKRTERSAARGHPSRAAGATAKRHASRSSRYATARSGRVKAIVPRASLVTAREPALQPRLLSVGEQLGLRQTDDPLQLESSVALVLDQESNQVLFNKNEQAVLPIASLTKLMTGLIVSEARLPMDQPITITPDDVDTEKHSRSRLAVGATLTRGEMLHLALMSSENRAAHALARTYPGGPEHFVSLMNLRAAALGMKSTRYVEPTGLSSDNRSSASDLARLVATAAQNPQLRQLTTSPGAEVAVGRRVLQYKNTDRLVKDPDWDIGLSKTGFIREAGDCLVMQARIAGRQLIMVFLDSTSKVSRIADAERVRRWVEARAQGDVVRVGESAARGPGAV
jgi:D-alanyl-D-alanine endopeptidase (penicillin-binding protein 7)